MVYSAILEVIRHVLMTILFQRAAKYYKAYCIAYYFDLMLKKYAYYGGLFTTPMYFTGSTTSRQSRI